MDNLFSEREKKKRTEKRNTTEKHKRETQEREREKHDRETQERERPQKNDNILHDCTSPSKNRSDPYTKPC